MFVNLSILFYSLVRLDQAEKIAKDGGPRNVKLLEAKEEEICTLKLELSKQENEVLIYKTSCKPKQSEGDIIISILKWKIQQLKKRN